MEIYPALSRLFVWLCLVWTSGLRVSPSTMKVGGGESLLTVLGMLISAAQVPEIKPIAHVPSTKFGDRPQLNLLLRTCVLVKPWSSSCSVSCR